MEVQHDDRLRFAYLDVCISQLVVMLRDKYSRIPVNVTALLPRNITFVVINSGMKRLVGVIRDTK
jgi:hypothetical protein